MGRISAPRYMWRDPVGCHNSCELGGADIVLVGNPNTGKSCLFNQLTGIGVATANYAGKTVEIFEGKSRFEGLEVSVADLPGVYSLGAGSEDERIAKEYLLKCMPKVVVNVVDANMLERNLYLTIQLLELGLPVVVALNFYEEAADRGLRIDEKALEKMLGVPVVPVDALRGAGMPLLAKKCAGAILNGVGKKGVFRMEYGLRVERALKGLSSLSGERFFLVSLLEKDPDAWKSLGDGQERAKKLVKRFSGGRDLSVDIARYRHGQAALFANAVSYRSAEKYSEGRLDRLTTEPATGLPILAALMLVLFFSLFWIGGGLSMLMDSLFRSYAAPPLTSTISLLPSELLRTVLRFAFVDGLNAGLQIAVPYVLVFYFIMAFLEDTGYLPRMAYLLDRVMHRLGLHGKAVIPMMLGFGCNVPAILATRVLPSSRERFLSSILICMVPCSARTAVILGAAGFYLGWQYAFLIYAVVLALIFLSGFVLGRSLPGEYAGLVLELPPYRMPSLKNLFAKTWLRLRDFVFVAFPIVVVGSGMLGLLKALGLLEALVRPAEPVVSGWLMLPAVAGITLVYGVLRKELALEMLIVLGGSSNLLSFMSPVQVFVFSLVTAIYIPCIATIAVFVREFGWRKSIAVSVGTIVLAVLVGGIAGRLLLYFGLI